MNLVKKHRFKSLIFLFILLTQFAFSANLTQIAGGDLYSLVVDSDGALWAVGDNGTILSTINGGENWISENSGTAQTLRSVSNGWIVGDSAKIFQYDGSTWQPVV